MRQDSEKIVFIEGPKEQSEMPLKKTSLLLGRADAGDDWKPEIDLAPGFKVSRKHGRLFSEKGSWWLEDTGSKHGTFTLSKGLSLSK